MRMNILAILWVLLPAAFCRVLPRLCDSTSCQTKIRRSEASRSGHGDQIFASGTNGNNSAHERRRLHQRKEIEKETANASNASNSSKPGLSVTEGQITPDQDLPNHQSLGYTGWSPEVLAGGGADGIEENGLLGGSIYDNARSVFAEISEDILGRWGSGYANTTLFSGGMEFSDGGKVVQDKMLNAVLEQRGFLAVFTGVSTTAGHDVLYEQSYPVVLNDTMGRLMAAAGVRYEAINVAMGNTRVVPYSLCVDAHAGYDADIISWDMYMMVPGPSGVAPPAVELFIRSASVLPRRPAVLLTDASPDNRGCLTRAENLRLRNDRLHAAGTQDDLMKVYREFGLHRMTPSDLVPGNTCGDELFEFDHLYNASLKDYSHPAGWHAAPPGHQLVADMLFMQYAEVFLGALERLNRVVPGVTASQLRGYGEEIEDTPTPTGSAKRVGGTSFDKNSLGETLQLGMGAVNAVNPNDSSYMGGGRGDILPPPAWCLDWRFCSGAGNYRCANTYFPLAAGESARLVNMVSDKTPAILNHNHSEIFAEPTPGHWAITLNENSPRLLEYLKAEPPAGFHHPIDKKFVLVGTKASGPIEFEFQTVGAHPRREEAHVNRAEGRKDGDEEKLDEREGEEFGKHRAMMEPKEMGKVPKDSRVVVCKPDFIDRADFTNSSEVRFRVDGVEAPAMELEQGFMAKGSCVILETEIGIGHHTLMVEPLKDQAPSVAVSHVLYPA